jgi:hypothetical protein
MAGTAVYDGRDFQALLTKLLGESAVEPDGHAGSIKFPARMVPNKNSTPARLVKNKRPSPPNNGGCVSS